MISGKNAVILDIEDARKLHEVVTLNWSKEDIIRLQKIGALEVINKLREIVRGYDD